MLKSVHDNIVFQQRLRRASQLGEKPDTICSLGKGERIDNESVRRQHPQSKWFRVDEIPTTLQFVSGNAESAEIILAIR